MVNVLEPVVEWEEEDDESSCAGTSTDNDAPNKMHPMAREENQHHPQDGEDQDHNLAIEWEEKDDKSSSTTGSYIDGGDTTAKDMRRSPTTRSFIHLQPSNVSGATHEETPGYHPTQDRAEEQKGEHC